METPKKPTRPVDVAARMRTKRALKDMLFAGVQAVGGAALAFYTYKNSPSPISPSVYSVIALGGTYNVIKNIRKIFWRSAGNEGATIYSLHKVATGTIVYFGSLYAFSEAWRSNHKLWMPCLGFAASGFFYALSSTYSKKRVSTVKPLSTCCQMAFAPALILSGATYLLCFRNHEEGWLFWFPLVATAAIGCKYSFRCLLRENVSDKILLLKSLDVLMGGCFLTVSSIIWAIYVSKKEFHWFLKYFTVTLSLFGVNHTNGAIVCVQRNLGVDEELVRSSHGIIIGTEFIFLACLMVKCKGYQPMTFFMFPILAGNGLLFLCYSVCWLYRLVPRPVFIRYCQRALGPLLTLGSSLASAYIGYRFGWRSSMLMTPFVPAGIYVTYKGFSRTDES